MKNPKISIIIAVQNNAAHIGDCLESFQSQTMEEFEVIVVDVNSTDGTKDRIAEAAAADERIVFLADSLGSLGHARNMALNYVRAPYVLFVEPDEYLNKEALAYMSRALDNDPEADMYSCETDCFGEGANGRTNEDRKRICAEANREDSREREIENRLMRGLIFDNITMYRRSYLLDNGITFYEEPGAGRQDLAFRFLALVKGKFSFSVEILCERRMDVIKSRITDVRSALDVCNEFRALEVRLKEEPKLWWKTRLVFWQSYYEQNMLFYEKLSGDIRPSLLKRMQGDLQNAVYQKEFSRDHFDVTVRDEMELLLESTAEFDRLQRNKEQERRKEASRKDWMAVMSEKKEDELERTTSVVDSLGLYPEPLKIRLREGLLYGFG